MTALPDNAVLRHALRLAERGVPVFPCRLDKTPYTVHGFKNAGHDPAVITAQWTRWPDALIGSPTGIKFDVVDVDLHHEAARQWHDEHRYRIPTTRTHRTRSGGLHLLFRPYGTKCSAGLISANVDTRGRGGYIIWWPAHGFAVQHPSTIAPMPAWLIAALKPPPHTPRSTSDGATLHGDGWLRGLVRTVASAPEGQRNKILFWASCRAGEAVRDGKASEGFTIAVLIEAAACRAVSARGAADH